MISFWSLSFHLISDNLNRKLEEASQNTLFICTPYTLSPSEVSPPRITIFISFTHSWGLTPSFLYSVFFLFTLNFFYYLLHNWLWWNVPWINYGVLLALFNWTTRKHFMSKLLLKIIIQNTFNRFKISGKQLGSEI